MTAEKDTVCVWYIRFYQKVDDLEYKVSIIMTTRSAAGAAYERGIKNK